MALQGGFAGIESPGAVPATATAAPRGNDRLRGVWAPASALGAVACLADTFLPWIHGGAVERNAYQLLAATHRAGLLRGNAAMALSVAGYLLPVVVAVALAALLGGRRVMAQVVALVAAAIMLTGSGVAVVKYHSGLLMGPFLGLSLSSLTVVSVAVPTLIRRSRQ